MAELMRELLIDATKETIFEFLTISQKHQKHIEWMGTNVVLDPRPGRIYGLPTGAVDDHTKGWDIYFQRLSQVGVGGTVGPDVPDDEVERAGERQGPSPVVAAEKSLVEDLRIPGRAVVSR